MMIMGVSLWQRDITVVCSQAVLSLTPHGVFDRLDSRLASRG